VPVLALGTRSLRRWALLSGAALALAGLPGLCGARWLERGADEVARLLGYGPAIADEAARSLEVTRQKPWSWRSLAEGRLAFLRVHPTYAEQIARMRSADGNPERPYRSSPLG
jgi:Zn-dependent protease with chaperone function